jgi:hypothetical protein
MTSADPGSRPAPLAPKIVSEVHELHQRNVELARDGGGLRLRNRRERREAKEAESDLLRVLGFDSYEAFQTRVVEVPDDLPRADDEGAAVPPALALVDNAATESELDAQKTEAALLRVLRANAPQVAVPDRALNREGHRAPHAGVEPGDLDQLRRRIAYFEEELAETRFELINMRDRVRTLLCESEAEAEAKSKSKADDVHLVDGAVPAAAAALVQAAGELRALCEVLRDERAQIAALGADARAESERMLERARVEAQRLGDEAASQARALLDQASADAVALTRNAISTVDGLRRLADDAASGSNRDRSA